VYKIQFNLIYFPGNVVLWLAQRYTTATLGIKKLSNYVICCFHAMVIIAATLQFDRHLLSSFN